MSLKEFFSRPATPDKEAVLRDRSTILAYLEELCRLRTSVMLWFARNDLLPVTAKVDGVGEESGTITLQLQRALPGEIDPRFPVEMLFPLDGMRFRCPIRFKDRGGYMKAVFGLPEVVHHAERREKLRTRFSQREGASVTVLEGLFQGHGASGRLLNLSLEGLCMRVEKAISIHDNRRLAVGSGLFQPRQELMVVRILDLPHTPTIECAGLVMHIEDGPESVTMGLQLGALGAVECQALSQLLTRRIPTFGRGFPQKRRRCEMDLEAPAPEAEPPLEVPAETAAEAPPEEEPAPAEDSRPQGDRLERMRKRARRLLLVQLDDLDRAILAGTLLADGFTQVQEARNFGEAMRTLRTAPVDLVLIEEHVGAIPAQLFLSNLRKAGRCEEVPTVLLAERPDVKTQIMARAANIAHVQRHPVDYDGELRGVLYGLLKIAKG